MTCSIGIAPTRLLAKIASNLEKPDGLTVLSVDDMPGRVENLSLKDLSGIGDAMVARLHEHGIRSVRELWEVSRDRSVRIWGSVAGAQWWDGFHGQDEPETPTRRHSMSHGSVLAPRFRDDDGAYSIMVRLVCKLGHRLRRNGYVAGSLRISVKGTRGGRFSEEITLPSVDDTPTLLRQFHTLWQRRPPAIAPIRKVEACVSGLVPASQVPSSLFDDTRKLQRLSRPSTRSTTAGAPPPSTSARSMTTATSWKTRSRSDGFPTGGIDPLGMTPRHRVGHRPLCGWRIMARLPRAMAAGEFAAMH